MTIAGADGRAERVMYISVGQLWRLAHAVRPVQEAFGGATVYLVGSVLERDDYRDVDLRMILPDEEFGRLFELSGGLRDQFKMLLHTSISMMLENATNLPIDFQLQSQTEANEFEGRRNAVCNRPYVNSDYEPAWMKPDQEMELEE